MPDDQQHQTSFLSLLLVEKSVDVAKLSIIQDNAHPPTSPRRQTQQRPSVQHCRWQSDPMIIPQIQQQQQHKQQQEEEDQQPQGTVANNDLKNRHSRWARRDSADSTLIKPARREFLTEDTTSSTLPAPQLSSSSSSCSCTKSQHHHQQPHHKSSPAALADVAHILKSDSGDGNNNMMMSTTMKILKRHHSLFEQQQHCHCDNHTTSTNKADGAATHRKMKNVSCWNVVSDLEEDILNEETLPPTTTTITSSTATRNLFSALLDVANNTAGARADSSSPNSSKHQDSFGSSDTAVTEASDVLDEACSLLVTLQDDDDER